MNVLKADCSAGDAYAEIDFGVTEGDPWYIQLEILIPTATFTALAERIITAALIELGLAEDDALFVTAERSSGAADVFANGQRNYSTNAGPDMPVPGALADVYHTILISHVAGTITWNIDGTDAFSYAVAVTLDGLKIGGIHSAGLAGEIYYIANLAVGTTPGGTDIFADNFSSGDLSSWTSTTGDVSVVGDPTAPAGPAIEGINFAPDDPPLSETEPTWVRLDLPENSWRVTGFHLERGRGNEQDEVDTGTSTVTIIDRDGSFDPTCHTSPFWDGANEVTKVDPMRPAAIALPNPCTGGYGTIFRGTIDELLGDIYQTSRLQTVTLECIDGLGLLLAHRLAPGVHGDTAPAESGGDLYFQETSGIDQVRQRLNKCLDDVGWPTTRRHLASGNVQLQAIVYDRFEAMIRVVQEAAMAEFPGVGVIFDSKDGAISFHGRYMRFFPDHYQAADDASRGPNHRIVFWNLGSKDIALADPSVCLINGLSWRRSSQDIINACFALPKDVNLVDVPGALIKDDDSVTAYGWRQVSFEDLLVLKGDVPSGTAPTAVQECKLYATYYVDNYAQPKTRVTKIIIRGRNPRHPCAPAIWAFLCGVELNDVIQLDTNHWNGDGGFHEQYFVEKLTYDASPLRGNYWDVTLEVEVSPATFYAINPFPAPPPPTPSFPAE